MSFSLSGTLLFNRPLLICQMATRYKKDSVVIVVVVVIVGMGVMDRKYNETIYISFILKNKGQDIKNDSYTCIKS